MAVYEKDLTLIQRIITRVFEILEPLMNTPLNQKIIGFVFQYLKLGKVTRCLGEVDLLLGGYR